MKAKLLLIAVLLLLFPALAPAQDNLARLNAVEDSKFETLEQIRLDLKQIAKSLDTFNARLNQFMDGLNKYKGVQLSEQQQKLIFGYEVLNQTEQLAATLRKSLIETAEKEAALKRRLGLVETELRPENIERSIQLRGTTRAEEARDVRRKAFEDERNSLQSALAEIVQSRLQLTEDLRQTETFAQSFRKNLFSQIRNELSNF
jgi:hypothetical protein